MGRKILGLDIGPEGIKYGLVKNGGHPQLLACGSLPVFSDLGDDYSLTEHEIDISAVVLAVKEAAVRTPQLGKGVDGVAICLNSPQTVVRPITLPALPESELAAAVEYELSQSFPGLAKTYAVSFREYTRTKKEIQGIVAFSPKKGLEIYRRILEQLNYRHSYVDVAANAAAKAWAAFSDEKTAGITLLCEVGGDSTRFTVVRGRRVLHSRQVAEGVGIVPRQMSGGRTDREKWYDPAELERMHQSAYAGILEQLSQTVEFFNQNNGRENAVSKVALIGAGVDFPELSGYFSAGLNLPVTVAEPPAKALVDSGGFSAAFLAIGAAVREDG